MARLWWSSGLERQSQDVPVKLKVEGSNPDLAVFFRDFDRVKIAGIFGLEFVNYRSTSPSAGSDMKSTHNRLQEDLDNQWMDHINLLSTLPADALRNAFGGPALYKELLSHWLDWLSLQGMQDKFGKEMLS